PLSLHDALPISILVDDVEVTVEKSLAHLERESYRHGYRLKILTAVFTKYPLIMSEVVIDLNCSDHIAEWIPIATRAVVLSEYIVQDPRGLIALAQRGVAQVNAFILSSIHRRYRKDPGGATHE